MQDIDVLLNKDGIWVPAHLVDCNFSLLGYHPKKATLVTNKKDARTIGTQTDATMTNVKQGVKRIFEVSVYLDTPSTNAFG